MPAFYSAKFCYTPCYTNLFDSGAYRVELCAQADIGGLRGGHLVIGKSPKFRLEWSFRGDSVIKADIIRSIELKLSLSHHEASLLVEQIINIIKDELSGGDPVIISGFGQWKVRQKNSRIGRNPKSKEEYVIPPRRVVTFYSSNVWRKELSNN